MLSAFPWPASLRARLLFVITMTVLPLIALSFYTYVRVREDRADSARASALAIAAAVTAEQEHVFARGEEVLALLAADVAALAPGGLPGLDVASCTAQITRVQRYNPAFLTLGVLDDDGVVRCASSPAIVGLDFSDRQWFQDVARANGFVVSPVIFGRIDDIPTLVMADAIRDPRGRFAGAVALNVDLVALSNAVNEAALPEGAALSATDRAGVIITRNPDPAAWIGKRLPDALQHSLADSTGATLINGHGVDGAARLYVSVPLPAGSYGHIGFVTLGVPSHVIYGPANAAFRNYALGLLLIATVAVLAAVVGGERALLRPMRRLQAVALSVAGGDLGARSGPPYAHGELGQLASAIDELAESLSNRLAEVSTLNAGLEQRVQARTAELEKVNHQLSAANDELETFAYSVSHDLRAPLRALDGFSQMLVQEYGTQLDERGHDRLRRIREAAQRMGTLIDDLLRLSRTARTPLRIETVDLSAVAHTIAEALQEEAPARAVEFRITDGLYASADRGLLRAVLQNLLGNAWKFTSGHASARIEFGVTERDGQQVFFVRDDGAGFEMQYADKLFGPFQRLHTPAEFPGSGIGLATVQRIVHRHGGQIWAEATVEEGATFYFTLAAGTASASDRVEAA